MSIGIKPYIREEMVTAGRYPVAADKGAIAQRLVFIGVSNTDERNHDVGDFPGEVWWGCLKDGQHLW